MEIIQELLGDTLDILNIKFILWGFEFSMWQLCLYATATDLLAYIVWTAIDDNNTD